MRVGGGGGDVLHDEIIIVMLTMNFMSSLYCVQGLCV